ncbi:BTAD domain-containing putative transcriptional regulator [Streptantibioticus ferralitis]|uniref:BTAD domain-containing putative transcriptional regulator n=1 Tax=Streptantibioticus ferralitis TaxID=236510 RepID=A0ABT5Z1G6_9ACTN|nr:BTAD domain-containing putative transcriptional regulator [Streptantibioticus ferralitis]MDF2257678.1 BTAD domain-containing putative transcriptional regulator [Streptantibioticus ferralitis]
MNAAVTTAWGRVCAFIQLLLSATGLAAVTVGIPYALAVSAGVPWPAPVTSLGDLASRLAQPVSDPFVTRLLALAGWVCWAAFMLCLLREAAWATRQLRTLLGDVTLLRTRLHTLPAHRAAAGFLVATLLLALAAMWRPVAAHAASGMGTARPVVSVAAPTAGTGQAARSQRAEEPATVAYTVQPGDTLWDIARAHLGDPLRWPVIYQLNCNRIQPDGQRLRDPDLLLPGWTLHLPTHSDTGTAHAPRPQPAPAAPMPHHDAVAPPHQHPTTPPHASIPAQHREQAAAPRLNTHPAIPAPSYQRHQRAVDISVGTASTIGITTAAGIAAAVSFARAHARRRRQPDLTAAAPPPLADAVRAATTAHLAACQERHESAEQDETTLHHPSPAKPTPPGTVACATRDGHELIADLLAVPGGITLTGPGADPGARALAIAVLSAAERLRPVQPKVRLITPTATAQRLLLHATGSLPAWAITGDCAQALSLIEQSLLHRARLADSDEADIVSAADEPPMDLLITDLDPRSVERLKATAHRAAPGQLAVVILGADDWPCHVQLAAEGTVTAATGPAVQHLSAARMFTLASEPAHELLDTLYAAHGHTAPAATTAPPPPCAEAPVPPAHRPPSTPTPALQQRRTHENNQPLDQQNPKSTEAEICENQRPSAPVTVHILGRFRIRARGKGEEFGHGMRAETREFLCLLAAHPKGIRGEEITEALRTVTDPEQAGRELANLRRAVRRSLRQATGAQQAAFVVRAGDRHLLDHNLIATDIAAFTAAVQQASTARDDTVRATALRAAVTAYGGQLCEGADYPWADELREAVHRKAVDALVLLADHTAKSHPDPDEALALLDQAAEWDPYNEAVYQRTIRLQRTAGRDDAAHRTYALLKRRLADLDATPDPATTALVQRQQAVAAR